MNLLLTGASLLALAKSLYYCISKSIEFFTICTSLTMLLIIGSFVRLHLLNGITYKSFVIFCSENKQLLLLTEMKTRKPSVTAKSECT